MKLDMPTDCHKLAELVDEAAKNVVAIPQLSESTELNFDDAYEIQRLSIERRFERGEQQTGIKMGFTSRAKMRQMGVNETIWGRITDGMLEEDGGEIDLGRYIHPRAEPEIAFLLKRSLSGSVTPAQALAAVEAVAPAIEIIDSRYRDFKFTLEDVIADNSSSSGYVVGAWTGPQVDVSNLGMMIQFNNRPVGIGSSAALLGHPVRSLVSAARMMGAYNQSLEPGWIVLAGASTAAQYLESGTYVSAEVEALGRVDFRVA